MRLHASHVSYRATDASPATLALVAAAGPCATALLVAVGAVARRWAAVAAAVGFVAPQRCFASVLYLASCWAGNPWVVPSDEARLAELSGTPTAVWAGASAVVLAGGIAVGVSVVRRLPHATRGPAITGLSVGCACGWLLHSLVGRWLLP